MLMVIGAILAVGLASLTGQAFAHVELRTANPTPNEVNGPPDRIELEFFTRLFSDDPSESVKLALLDPDSEEIPLGPASITGDRLFAHADVDAPGFEWVSGTYQIRWAALGEDGDLVQNVFLFTVDPGLPPTDSILPDDGGSANAAQLGLIIGAPLVLVGVVLWWVGRRKSTVAE